MAGEVAKVSSKHLFSGQAFECREHQAAKSVVKPCAIVQL